MAMVEVKCPYCNKTDVSKYGKNPNGIQKYICNNKDCPRKIFQLDYAYNGRKPGVDEKIVKMACNASGIRDTARVLGISTDKVMDTLKKRKRP
jgi:transposase-like protein